MWMFWVQGQICFQPCHFLKHNLSLFELPSIHFLLTRHAPVDKKKFCALQLFTQECIDIKTHLLLLGVKMYLVWNKWHISAVSRHKPLWNKNFFFLAQRAGVPMFSITNNPNEVRLQMYILDFIQRMEHAPS